MKIESNKLITEKEGYEAMWLMLYSYWKLTDSNDLTDFLSGGQYIAEDYPADSAFWEYWKDAVEKVKSGQTIPLKVLYKD